MAANGADTGRPTWRWLVGLLIAALGTIGGGMGVMAYTTLNEYATSNRAGITKHTEQLVDHEARLRVMEATNTWMQRTMTDIQSDVKATRTMLEEHMRKP